MRALLCEAYGEPESLALRDVPLPEPAADEVRIRVSHAGVNFPDTLIIRNLYQIQPPLPFSPGGEVSGWIDAVGADVRNFAVGDRVSAMTLSGAFAEHVTVKAASVLPVPDAVPLDVAAVLTMAYGTSIHALAQRGALQPGETVLVLGAAGGVGLAAVEIAKAMGARVIAAASSAEKRALTEAHGADVTVDSSAADFRAALRAAAGKTPIDVIYDPVGGALAEPAFRSIGGYGRYLVVGFAAGTVPSIPLNLPLLKNASIVGVFWGAFSAAEPEALARDMASLYGWYAEGKIAPRISRRFSLAEGGAAIRWMMERQAAGKAVVEVAKERS